MAYAKSKKGQKKKKGAKTGPKPREELEEKNVKLLEQAFLRDLNVSQIACYLNVSRQTIYNWQEEFPELFDRLEGLRNQATVWAKDNILHAIEKGDLNTSKWYLEKKEKADFGNSLDITTQGEKVGQPLSESDKKELLTKALETLKREDKKKCKK